MLMLEPKKLQLRIRHPESSDTSDKLPQVQAHLSNHSKDVASANSSKRPLKLHLTTHRKPELTAEPTTGQPLRINITRQPRQPAETTEVKVATDAVTPVPVDNNSAMDSYALPEQLLDELTQNYVDSYPEEERIIPSTEDIPESKLQNTLDSLYRMLSKLYTKILVTARLLWRSAAAQKIRRKFAQFNRTQQISLSVAVLAIVVLASGMLLHMQSDDKSARGTDVLGASGTIGSNNTITPEFEYLKTDDRLQAKPDSYDPQNKVVSFNQTIGGSAFIITQQKLPGPENQSDNTIQLKQLAESLDATNSIATNKGLVFYSEYDSKAPKFKQVFIFKYDDLLVNAVLKNDIPLTKNMLSDFVNNLKI